MDASECDLLNTPPLMVGVLTVRAYFLQSAGEGGQISITPTFTRLNSGG